MPWTSLHCPSCLRSLASCSSGASSSVKSLTSSLGTFAPPVHKNCASCVDQVFHHGRSNSLTVRECVPYSVAQARIVQQPERNAPSQHKHARPHTTSNSRRVGWAKAVLAILCTRAAPTSRRLLPSILSRCPEFSGSLPRLWNFFVPHHGIPPATFLYIFQCSVLLRFSHVGQRIATGKAPRGCPRLCQPR